jgi:hypothetical protein
MTLQFIIPIVALDRSMKKSGLAGSVDEHQLPTADLGKISARAGVEKTSAINNIRCDMKKNFIFMACTLSNSCSWIG